MYYVSQAYLLLFNLFNNFKFFHNHPEVFERLQIEIDETNYFTITEVVSRQKMWSSEIPDCGLFMFVLITIAADNLMKQALFLLKLIRVQGAGVSLKWSAPPQEPGEVEEGIVSHFHVPLMNCW